MSEDLKKFRAVFAEWIGPQCRMVTMEFHTEDGVDALVVFGGYNLDVRRLGAKIVVQLLAQVSGVAHPGSSRLQESQKPFRLAALLTPSAERGIVTFRHVPATTPPLET